MENNDKQQLAKLKRIFAKTIAGDFSQKVDFSDVSDKFFETFVGVQIVLDTIREIQKKNQELEEKLKETERLKPPR